MLTFYTEDIKRGEKMREKYPIKWRGGLRE